MRHPSRRIAWIPVGESRLYENTTPHQLTSGIRSAMKTDGKSYEVIREGPHTRLKCVAQHEDAAAFNRYHTERKLKPL